MFKRFLAFLKESPFIEGMGRVFDFFGVIESSNDDEKKDTGDFKHLIILVEEKGHGRERNTQQQSISA
jgi:hypothetical protein